MLAFSGLWRLSLITQALAYPLPKIGPQCFSAYSPVAPMNPLLSWLVTKDTCVQIWNLKLKNKVEP